MDSSASNQAISNPDTESAHRQQQDGYTEVPVLQKQTKLDSDTCGRSNRLQVIVSDSEGSNCGRKEIEFSLPSPKKQGNSSALAKESEDSVRDKLKAEPLTVTQNCSKGNEKKTAREDSVDSDSSREEPPLKKMRADEGNDPKERVASSSQCDPPTSDLWSELTRRSLAQGSSALLSSWDFSEISFPDIGGRETVSLSVPPAHLLPPNTSADEEYEDVCMFDVEDYRRQQQLQLQSVL